MSVIGDESRKDRPTGHEPGEDGVSASLIVFIPLALVAVVGTLCFIGCGYPDFSFGSAYQQKILDTPNVLAYWPLGDAKDSNIAADIAPKPSPLPAFNGTYIGAATPGQPGIVTGDVQTTTQTTSVSTCALFSGGRVSVDFRQELNPGAFTFECWVKPGWTAADPQALRAVLVSATSAGAGYALFAQSDNFWEAQIGTGAGNFFSLKSAQPIALNADKSLNPVTYLAVTFDGDLKLYVGTAGGTLMSVSATPGKFVAEDSTAMPSTATPLFIGAGHPDATPGNPFNGFIQDVAFYGSALSFDTLNGHFTAGTNTG